ncbi:hypothetical protein CsSME_00011738 [Camellia sinensis var. sinensis]
MENMCTSVKTQNRDICVHHDIANTTQQMIDRCFDGLYMLDGIEPSDPLIDFVVSLMDTPANQCILLKIPTNEQVIRWLKMKEAQVGGPSIPTCMVGMTGWF